MMLLTFDYLYWVMLAPALLLGLWAQARVHSAFAKAHKIPAPMGGAAAARYVLDSAGLQNVAIEPVEGFLSDHYYPSPQGPSSQSRCVPGEFDGGGWHCRA